MATCCIVNNVSGRVAASTGRLKGVKHDRLEKNKDNKENVKKLILQTLQNSKLTATWTYKILK